MSAAHPAAIVFAAAESKPTARTLSRLERLRQPYVVAADGGAATALAFGYQPDVVVGDLDSIDAATLAELRRRSVPIETYPRDKDMTDGQLAVERALAQSPQELVLVGFLGGARLDQALANVFFLARVTTPAVLIDERNECRLIRPGDEHSWRTASDEIVSLLALTTEVNGVRTSGLRWPLDNATLRQGDTRGVSNEPAVEQASVSIASGLLLLTRHFPD